MDTSHLAGTGRTIPSVPGYLKQDVDLIISRLTRTMMTRMRTLTTNNTTLMAAEAGRSIRIGIGTTTALLGIGATQDITVPWSTPFAGSTYQYDMTRLGTLIGGGTVAHLSHDNNGITVRVTATVLLAVGAQFMVIGFC